MMRHAWQNLILATALLTASPCLAQEPEEPEAKSYVMAYFIVGAGVALGLVSVCRMSKRHKEVRKVE